MQRLSRARRRALILPMVLAIVAATVGVAVATAIPSGCDQSIGQPNQWFSDTCQAARSSSNGDVKGGLTAWAQRTVDDTGTASLTADGIFGSLTEAGVEDYQTDTGTTADGIVGSNTWIRMDMFGSIAPWEATGTCLASGYQFYIVDGASATHALRICSGTSWSNVQIDDFCVKNSSSSWKKASTAFWTSCS